MLHVERFDPCTPHDCGQYSQYLVLAVSTLAEACRSRRSTCARTCARSCARTSSSASSARTCRQGSGLTPPSRLPHGPAPRIAQLLTSVSREYSIALVRYRGRFKRTPCGLERLARLPLRLKGEIAVVQQHPTNACGAPHVGPPPLACNLPSVAAAAIGPLLCSRCFALLPAHAALIVARCAPAHIAADDLLCARGHCAHRRAAVQPVRSRTLFAHVGIHWNTVDRNIMKDR